MLANAQLIPDGTLSEEPSRVAPQGLRDLIEGGAIRDTTLFHSFREFNVNDAQQVYFANPDGIVNILTRVTGNNISRILGTLGVLGSANLFLINPNGIIFGSKSQPNCYHRYPQIMTKIRFQLAPKPTKAEKAALGKTGFVPRYPLDY